jgi:hypothetical protein
VQIPRPPNPGKGKAYPERRFAGFAKVVKSVDFFEFYYVNKFTK